MRVVSKVWWLGLAWRQALLLRAEQAGSYVGSSAEGTLLAGVTRRSNVPQAFCCVLDKCGFLRCLLVVWVALVVGAHRLASIRQGCHRS